VKDFLDPSTIDMWEATRKRIRDVAREVKNAHTKRHEDLFSFQLKAHKLPTFIREHRFALSIGRQWRFDFANPEFMIAVEVEGLIVKRVGGRFVSTGAHADINGFKSDCCKYAEAAILGWTVLRFEQSQVKTGEAVNFTKRLLHAKGYRTAQI
jgi:very-short-patch-repair endonuclease